jgi:glycine C-acetyltransferase
VASVGTDYSLADFLYLDSDDPLAVPVEFDNWRQQTAWATALYEQALLDGPRTTTRLDTSHDARLINMASYNYLGMSHDPRVQRAAKEAIDHYGVGACGSPLLSGMTDLHLQLEQRMAKFLGRGDCLLFSSGFGGALGLMAATLRRGDVAVIDEKCHVSLVDGVRLSGAKLELFRHNDPDHLDELLAKHEGVRRLIAIEGVYSMDGDIGDLPSIADVASKHGVGIVIDEAHSVLTFGENGRGVAEYLHREDSVTLVYGTFSKAFASVGGFVAGPESLIAYIRYYASTYGFSCALPPSVVAAVLAVLDIVESDQGPKKALEENAKHFRQSLQAMGINTGNSCSQVVPIILGSDRHLLYELGIALREAGLFVSPVDYPSVPEDSLRFRASVTGAHSRQELDRALEIIGQVVLPRVVTG